jgi:hypothetical protein
VRFELGHANNVEVPDPWSADESTHPAIVMMGRTSGSLSPGRGNPLLGPGVVVVVDGKTLVVVGDAWFPPPPEHALTQRTRADTNAPDERPVTPSV